MVGSPGIEAEGGGCLAAPEDAVPLTLETSIDLEGHAWLGRLVADGQNLVVSNTRPESREEWRLAEIDAFRVQPAIGSYFIQARMAGRWTDLLRRPGAADQQVTEFIDRLNAKSQGDGRARESSSRGAAGEPAGVGDAPPRRMVAHFLSLLRPFYGSVLLLLGLSAAAVAIEVIPPLLQRMLIDRVLTTEAAKNPSQQLLVLLAAIVVGLLLVRLAGAVVGVWKGYISSHVGTAMTADLRNALVEKLNALPLAFHDRNQVGVLMSQVAYDTETLHTLVYHMTTGLLLQSLQLVGISIAMSYLNPRLALITLLPMPVILSGSWYFTRYLQPRQHHYWEAVGKQASALMGMLSGIRVVKAFVQEEREIRRFRRSSGRLRDSRLTVDVSTSTFTRLYGLAVCHRRPGRLVCRRPRRPLRPHDARFVDGILRLPGHVLHPADVDRRIDGVVCQFLRHQPPHLRRLGRAQRSHGLPFGAPLRPHPRARGTRPRLVRLR